MKTIDLKNICGVEILSRSNIRRLYDFVDDSTEFIDMSEVKFVSRSVADELCEICDMYPDIKILGEGEDVKVMLDIVRKGRNAKRNYLSKAKISVTFNCNTMEDLRKAIFSFRLQSY